MVFFIMFVLGAVVLGAGAMLAPAWSTSQPRIGIAATFALALVVGGAVFWANLFGWSTLVVDYLLFALVSIVILGGTMAQAQHTSNNEEEISDSEVGWTGPEDLVFFAVVAFLFSMPLIFFVFPIGDTSAANGLITLAARDGNSFSHLAPYYPDTVGFFAPGFHALAAYLSTQLGQPIPQIHMAIGSVTAVLAVWSIYDFGSEIQNKRLGRAMALALLLAFGLLKMVVFSFYPQVMALAFAIAFVTYAYRVVQYHQAIDVLAVGLMLGAVTIVSPMMSFPLFAGYLIFLLASTFLPKILRRDGILSIRNKKKNSPPDASDSNQQTSPPNLGGDLEGGIKHLICWIGVPLIAIIAISPWLIKIPQTIDILRTDGVWGFAWLTAFPRQPLFLAQGFWMIPLLIIGSIAGWQKYRSTVLWTIGWIIASHIIYWLPQDFWLLGYIDLGDKTNQMALAPIIPYTMLSGIALLSLFEKLPQTIRHRLRHTIYLQAMIAAVVIPLSFYLWFSRMDTSFFYSQADFAAMQWLMENAPDSRVLNHQRDKWFMPATGIDSFNVELPIGILTYRGRIVERTPSLADNLEVLTSYDVNYIFIPHWRIDDGTYSLSDTSFLEVTFEQDGAIVYRVIPQEN